MYISLIIGLYKRLDNLSLILAALKRQHHKEFEVVVAEDDNDVATGIYLEAMRKEVSFPIKHVSQADQGFRKNRILNEAIKVSDGPLIVFIDGDCIPHAYFLYQYAHQFEPFTMLYGRRVMLSEELSNNLHATQDLSMLSIFHLLRTKCTLIEEGIYMPFDFIKKKKFKNLVGSNWGIEKQVLLEVNGFDEDYIRAGVGEDTDIEWRLLRLGVKNKSLKFKAIQYHLYHAANYSSEVVRLNMVLLDDKKRLGFARCKNGIQKLI